MSDLSAKQPCADCVTGHLHEGPTSGTEQKLFGLDTYVAGDKAEHIVICFTDIFGWKINNVRLIADLISRQTGYQVLIPDFHQGDSLPLLVDEVLQPDPKAPPKPFFTRAKNMMSVVGSAAPWFYRHREATSRPLIENFIEQLRRQHPGAKVAGIGYCWGGRYALLGTHARDTSTDPLLDCAVLCHPSLTSDSEYAAAKRPISLQIGDQDQGMSMAKVESARKIIDEHKMGQTIIYPGQKHGFAARGSQTEEDTVKAQNKCNADAIAFFKAHL
ncbi:dienelactone hydrolase [Protomyces lactucae-debilis]|uniref:Dienelactone hydrolase n=1 Tax=Protomyces lactucae-debilis TaxID=2754530 RepID=A0A1Y2F1D2_PROLT|nr:dienelactone hydrolase [Protomyces lactucae-debilis]ORY77688.1 dienelactone hydrolase [Protomyces lactucae-debilis]